jgi:hypothetical protein
MDFEQVYFKRSSRFDETFRLYFIIFIIFIKIKNDAGLNFWFLLLKNNYKVAIKLINYYLL